MKYRALVKGVRDRDGHVIQIYGGLLSKIVHWAEYAAARYKAPVEIYQTEERLLETIIDETESGV